jgi:protein-tyrosine phosphatase
MPGEPPAPGPAPAHAGFDPEMRVDWLAPDELAGDVPGRLGMTFLPGKSGVSGRYPGHVYRRDASADLAALHSKGVRRLVLMVEDAELERWSDPAIVELGRAVGVDVLRFPVPDGHAPSPAMMGSILGTVQHGRRLGDVVVACMGGVGRTGTVVACALVEAGLSPQAAIARVRAVRHPTAVETAEQEALVREYARAIAEPPRS